VIKGSSHVSVAMLISGLVLSMRFTILSCFFLMDWQLTFRILSGSYLVVFSEGLLFFLKLMSGVALTVVVSLGSEDLCLIVIVIQKGLTLMANVCQSIGYCSLGCCKLDSTSE